MRSYYIDLFVKLFIGWVCCLILGLIGMFASFAEEGFIVMSTLFGVACVIITYVMFYVLCRDIIDRKDYGDKQIPLLPIVLAIGPFAMVYVSGLTDNNDQIPVLTPDDSWVCTCGGRNSKDTDICEKCGRTSDGKMTKQALQPEAFSIFKTWNCPKCGQDNSKSTDTCKECGYKR